jgi:hypothetical protein
LHEEKEKANLFANRLETIHQDPDYHGFNEGWKTSVERFLNVNPRSFNTNPMQQYLEAEDGDDSPHVQKVTIDEIRQNLTKFKNRSAIGLDGISYRLLKKLPDSYMDRIANIFSNCLHLGHFPAAWKNAKTILIPKPGKDVRQAKNYRPISLLSCLGKVLERIIAHRLSSHMEENKLFAKSQSGFRAHHMTTEQLLRLSEEWSHFLQRAEGGGRNVFGCRVCI